MNAIKVYVETGQKRSFVSAVDLPGWCRSGRDEETALQALIDYGPRYAQVLHGSGMDFRIPTDSSALIVAERHKGNATTDFGAPDAIPEADRERLDRMEFERLQAILLACWRAFDRAVGHATGRELRKGPRGGGRDLGKIIEHVLGAEQGYLARLAWRYKREGGIGPDDELARTRQAVLNALEVALHEGMPERGPRGGVLWPARYFVRRVAWHTLDHAWEIEDRIL